MKKGNRTVIVFFFRRGERRRGGEGGEMNTAHKQTQRKNPVKSDAVKELNRSLFRQTEGMEGVGGGGGSRREEKVVDGLWTMMDGGVGQLGGCRGHIIVYSFVWV